MAPLTGIAFASNWLISRLNLNSLFVKTTRMATFLPLTFPSVMQAKYNEPCLPQYHEAMVEESSGTEQRIFAKILGINARPLQQFIPIPSLMPLLIGNIGEFILRSRMRQKKEYAEPELAVGDESLYYCVR